MAEPLKERSRASSETIAVRANGKILLSGEYLVVYGASALAIPTSRGSVLNIRPLLSPNINWLTRQEGRVVFTASLKTDGSIIETDNQEMAGRLSSIFIAILKLRNEKKFYPAEFISDLEFPMNWGLGSSSTLIYNLAKWAGVDAFKLSEMTFGGSGYDIACAGSSGPILYRREEGKAIYSDVPFNPPFDEMLHFIYLNKKVSSRQSVTEYIHLKNKKLNLEIQRVSDIAGAMIRCRDQVEFSGLVNEHEAIMSAILNRPSIADLLFRNCPGSLKSLGAWGGDFVLFIGHSLDLDYFREKGFSTIISYKDMIYRKL